MPPGVPALTLFTTLARDERLFKRFMAGGLLDRGNLTLRQRELIVDRVTARCGSEYEWGNHVALFGAKVGLVPAEKFSLVHGNPADECWSNSDACLLSAADELLERCDLTDATWEDLRVDLSPEAIIEIVMIVGFYRTVSALTNVMRLQTEAFAERFPPS